MKTVPTCLLCVYICFIATTAGNADFALYTTNVVKNTLPRKGTDLFPSFQLFLNNFSLEYTVFINGIVQTNNAKFPIQRIVISTLET